MSTARTNRDRYRVIFAKDAQELEAKLNDPKMKIEIMVVAAR